MPGDFLSSTDPKDMSDLICATREFGRDVTEHPVTVLESHTGSEAARIR
jgi:hypothetical protein